MEHTFSQYAPTPGLSVAGFKRFPTVDQVAKALNSKSTVSDNDASIRKHLVEGLTLMLTSRGQFSSVRGSTVPLCTLRLKSALRKLSICELDGRPMSISRARELLKLNLDSLDTIVLGMQNTVYPYEVILRPDNIPIDHSGAGFAWVVVQSSPDMTVRIMTATGRMDVYALPLPRLDDILYETYFGEGEGLSQLNTEIAGYNEQWKPDIFSTYAVVYARRTIINVVNQLVPTKEVKLEIFGSRLYEICKSNSDIDLSMTINLSDIGHNTLLRNFCLKLANVLRKQKEFISVIWIPHARVPIVKFTLRYNGNNYEGDLSFNNGMGPEKSRLIQAYISMDSRVPLFIMLLKHWADKRAIANSSVLNSFGLMMMGIAFLIDQRVVPPLQLLSTVNIDSTLWDALNKINNSESHVSNLYHDIGSPYCIKTGRALPTWLIDNHYTYYFNNPAYLRSWKSTNKMTTLELLYEMFKYYGSEFDPLYYAISPRLGTKSIKREFLYKLNAPSPTKFLRRPRSWRNNLRLLAIEDPFELSVNCGRNAPAEWVTGLFWEMRRAAWIINDELINAHHKSLTRLFIQPKQNIYADARLWTSVYRGLLLRMSLPANTLIIANKNNNDLLAKKVLKVLEY